MDVEIKDLTRDQQLLLYTIDYLLKWVSGTDDNSFIQNGKRIWIKELPLLAVIYYQIIKGSYETYDYAPTSVQFFGRSCYSCNISYEGVDDIEDLRELDILEKIRLSTAKHGFVTAYRITPQGYELLKQIPADVKEEVKNLFYCKKCNTHLKFYIELGEKPIIKMDCPICDESDTELDFLESEDVSYVSEPYFIRVSDRLVR
ncbi:MAG: hypothetical protein ACTSRR_09420 [Candidatus Heimdallarchaeaceae archaeon]